MPERDVNRTVSLILDVRKPHVWYYRPVPGIYGARSIDYLGCAWGYFFGIENKRENINRMTDAQQEKMMGIHLAGGATFFCNGDPLLYGKLVKWLEWCEQHPAPAMPTVPFHEIEVI